MEFELPKYLESTPILFGDDETEFHNIKDQIVKQFFAEYDQDKLAIILSAIGCKDVDCPALNTICSIDFKIISEGNYGKYLFDVGDKQNKQVVNSSSTTLINDGTEKIEVSSEFQSWTVEQNFQVSVSKTDRISSEATKSFAFTASQSIEINFTGQSVETGSINQTTVFFAQPQTITLDPQTKVDLSYEFYQFEQTSNYHLDFNLDPTSTIKHPAVNDESVVIFTSSPLMDFLTSHLEFVKNMKFAPGGIELIANEEGAQLKNFPASEKVTNFGIDVVFGDPVPIDPNTTTTTTETPDTTTTEEPPTTTEDPDATEPPRPIETTQPDATAPPRPIEPTPPWKIQIETLSANEETSWWFA